MSTLKIVPHDAPKLKKPSFVCDAPLNASLDKFELTSLLNKHNFTLFLGKGGSGKTTLLISLLQTPSLFKNIFHDIIIFIPARSRGSVSGDFWGAHIPDEQIYDDLTVETLGDAYEVAQANAKQNLKTLFIIDDLQKNLKDAAVQKLLLHANNNKRHAALSIWLCCQNYKQIPLQVRMNLTDLFVFKISKTEQRNVFEEQVEMPASVFEEILKIAYKRPHDFLYLNTNSQRVFLNWDELQF